MNLNPSGTHKNHTTQYFNRTMSENISNIHKEKATTHVSVHVCYKHLENISNIHKQKVTTHVSAHTYYKQLMASVASNTTTLPVPSFVSYFLNS